MRRRRDEWAVETAGLSHDARADVVRAVLRVVRPMADRFQTDVPWDDARGWPVAVRDAAQVLSPESRGYACTGWRDTQDAAQWEAYELLAPFAYSSDVWDARSLELASVCDEGTSVTVRAAGDLHEQLLASLRPLTSLGTRVLRPR